MKAAFIVMSILGCDDSGSTCSPVAQVQDQWQTIAACDAASEKHLAAYSNVPFPMVVAVCQTADTTALADSTEDASQMSVASRSLAPAPSPSQADGNKGIAERAMNLVKHAIPSRRALEDTVTYPVHVVTDTYSWVARKIAD
jgi:hypothetical protein